MTEFEGTRVRLAGVSVGEIRIRKIGPSPVDMARMAIVDDHMNPVSLSIFSAFSGRTRKLVDDLCRSIEADFIELLKADDTPQGFEEQPGEDEEGEINFR